MTTTPTQIQRHTDTDDRAALASVRVIETVAAATGEDPLAMAPLADAIDPDALDGLVDAGFEGHVSFSYAGHEVTVDGAGAVLIDWEWA